MEQRGIAPRQLLLKTVVSKAVEAFGDTTKPPAERIAPLRGILAAMKDPAHQHIILDQTIKAGFPSAMKRAAGVLGRGGPDTLRGSV